MIMMFLLSFKVYQVAFQTEAYHLRTIDLRKNMKKFQDGRRMTEILKK